MDRQFGMLLTVHLEFACAKMGLREESGLLTGSQAYPSGTKIGIDEHGTDGKHGRRRKRRVFLSLKDIINYVKRELARI